MTEHSPEKVKGAPLHRLVPNCSSVNTKLLKLHCQFIIVEILFDYANLC